MSLYIYSSSPSIQFCSCLVSGNNFVKQTAYGKPQPPLPNLLTDCFSSTVELHTLCNSLFTNSLCIQLVFKLLPSHHSTDCSTSVQLSLYINTPTVSDYLCQKMSVFCFHCVCLFSSFYQLLLLSVFIPLRF